MVMASDSEAMSGILPTGRDRKKERIFGARKGKNLKPTF